MRLAKSIRLNDIIEAQDGSHRSCQYLNMVCCNCGEDVIYRQAHTRQIGENTIPVAASWVHRDKEKARRHKDCELRVQAIPNRTLEEVRSQARNQRYKLIEKSYIAMSYKFNHIHYGSEIDAGYSWRIQEKLSRKAWNLADYKAKKRCREIQNVLRQMSAVELRQTIKKVFEQDISTPYGISTSKVEQQRELEQLKDNTIPNFHLVLCQEILE